MDLKFWMFCNRMLPGTLARILGCCPRKLRRIIERENRPRGDLAHRIEFVTRGAVTVDELIDPGKYQVMWMGDRAYGKKYKKPYTPVAIDLEIKEKLNMQLRKYAHKKLEAGPRAPAMKQFNESMKQLKK